jgi:hypothetical protein
MKKIIVIIFWFSTALFAQKSAFIGFNSTMSGRNIAANLSIPKGDNNFTFGFRVNINKFAHNDDQGKIYYKRLYATEPLHFLGVNFCYERRILKKWKNLKPFWFYDIQATYATTRNRMVLPYKFDPILNEILYIERTEIFGPFYWIENNIGIGFDVDLTERFYLKQKLGYGRTLVLGYEEQLLPKLDNWFSSEFGGHFSVSLGMKF